MAVTHIWADCGVPYACHVEEVHRTLDLLEDILHSKLEKTSETVKKIGVVTYLGHGPPLENVDPVCCREEEGATPTGLSVDTTVWTGTKMEVWKTTREVGSFTALGIE